MQSRALPLSLLSLLSFFALASACSSSSSGGGDASDAGAGTDAPSGVPGADGGSQADSGTVMGTPPMISLTAPVTASVSDNNVATVAITRAGDLAEAVTLTVTGLPTGVTATDLTIAAGSTTQNITLHATMTAPVTDSPAKVTASGKTASGLAASTSFDLDVGGLPGTLDTTFGSGGIAPGIGATGTQATGVGIQKNGSIVLGGYDTSHYIVARYSSSGVLDKTYGTMGSTATPPGSGVNTVYQTGTLAVDAMDRVVIGGAGGDNSASQLAHVARFTTAGVLDPTFDGTGAVTVGVKADTIVDYRGLILSGTNIVVAGGAFTHKMASLDASGAPVAGFTTPTLDPPAPNSGNYTATSIAAQSTGKLVVAGSTGQFVARVDPATGAVDTTFAIMGYFASGTSDIGFNAIAVGPNDRVYACGVETSTPKKAVLLALDSTGAQVNGFGDTGSGFVFKNFGDAGTDTQCNGVAVQADGRIVVVGSAVASGRSVMFVARYMPTNGALDPSFATGGIALVPVATATASANAVALSPDRRILVAGHGDMDFAVVRMWQ